MSQRQVRGGKEPGAPLWPWLLRAVAVVLGIVAWVIFTGGDDEQTDVDHCS